MEYKRKEEHGQSQVKCKYLNMLLFFGTDIHSLRENTFNYLHRICNLQLYLPDQT